MATSTGIGFAASGTIAIAGTATSTFAGPVSSTALFSTNGNITNLRFTGATGTDLAVTGTLLMPEGTLSQPGARFGAFPSSGIGAYPGNLLFFESGVLSLVLSDVLKEFRVPSTYSYSWSSAGDNLAAADTFLTRSGPGIISTNGSFRTGGSISSTNASVTGTVSVTSDVVVNGQSVCLEDGTNCPASGGGTITSSTWQYNLTNATIYPTTSTFDVLIGGNTTATAGIVLDGAGTSTFANRVSSTGFIAGIGTQTAPSYGFTGYGGGLWSAGADLRIVTDDLIIRNIADTGTAFRVAGGLATFGATPTPASHNAYDIGLLSSAWKNIYASGTLFAFGGQFSLVTSTQATTTWLNVGTTARLPADSLINGTTVCLSNGTNCPAGGSQDLQSVTGFGATTTDRIYTQGGIETPSIGINTADTSVYELNVNGEANFDAAVRMTNDLDIVDGSNNPIFVVRPLAGTPPSVGIGIEPFDSIALDVLGTVSSSDMIVMNDVVVSGQSVCLESGVNCPASGGAQTLAQVTALGASATPTLQLLGGFLAASSTVTSTFTTQNLMFKHGTSTATMTVASGTALQPSLTFFGDPDSGFYTRAHNTVDLAIAATHLMECNFNGCSFGSGSLGPAPGTNVLAVGATFSSVTSTILSVGQTTSTFLAFTSASGSSLTIAGQSVCLEDGTNCPVASAILAGVVELATIAETSAGTDATRAVTPDGLSQSIHGTKIVELYVTTSSGAFLAVNSASNTSTCFLVPTALNGMNLTAVQGQHGVAGSAGTSTQIQIRNETDVADMLTVPIHIDPGERNSSDAVTQPVINTATDDVASFDRICADVDAVENTPGKETIVSLTFSLP